MLKYPPFANRVPDPTPEEIEARRFLSEEHEAFSMLVDGRPGCANCRSGACSAAAAVLERARERREQAALEHVYAARARHAAAMPPILEPY